MYTDFNKEIGELNAELVKINDRKEKLRKYFKTMSKSEALVWSLIWIILLITDKFL